MVTAAVSRVAPASAAQAAAAATTKAAYRSWPTTSDTSPPVSSLSRKESLSMAACKYIDFYPHPKPLGASAGLINVRG